MTTLVEEKQPLQDHLTSLEVNVKTMYKELIDESEAQKTINDHLSDTTDKISKMKSGLKQKRDKLFANRCHLIQIQYDIL